MLEIREQHTAELTAPTRPHPYIPHQGVPGRVARTLADLDGEARVRRLHLAEALSYRGRGEAPPGRRPEAHPRA